MFVRRLAFLYLAVAVLVAVLGLQLGRLTVAEGASRRADAEARLDQRTFLATYRGRILDRHGRVLAEDRPSYDVAVEYEVMTGAWAARKAVAAARAEVGAAAWGELGPTERGALIERHLPALDETVERLYDAICRLGGIDRAELARRIDSIKQRVHTRAVAVWDRQRELEASRHGDDSAFTARPIREQRRPHVVLPKVPDLVAFEFRRLADEVPDTIEVLESTRREYPLLDMEVELDRSSLPRPVRSDEPMRLRVHGVADHVLGSMRDQVFATDIERRPFLDDTGAVVDLGGYRPVNDVVGARGIERSCEDALRGTRGMVERRLDTGAERRTEPVPGADVRLTIDIELQARVQGILTPAFGLATVQQYQLGWASDGTPNRGPFAPGWELNGAAVVVEVDTGDILAMVSVPTLADGEAMPESRRAQDQPLVHRAAESIYPPGSILKPLVFVSAVAAGATGVHDRIACTGHYFPENTSVARCWIYRERYGLTTHTARIGGPLDVVQALSRSCNIYFYTVARRLGMDRLVEWMRGFGLGDPLDVGLLVRDEDGTAVGEAGGSLPSPETIAAVRERGDNVTPIILGIGQGPIAWTPVQAANAYATLARGGLVRDVSLLLDDPRPRNERRSGDLALDPESVTLSMRGLRESVEEDYGTGNSIRYADRTSEPIVNAEGVVVWAKTGTAQAPAFKVDTDGDGERDELLRNLDHAWFVGLVGPEGEGRPRYAIAVILEHGGSGGRTAGPVANQIVRAMQELGYLPTPPARAGAPR